MDIWNQLLGGFATAGTPINLLWAFVGCAIGTGIGVLPGLGPAVTVAMLLPITAQVEPTASMIVDIGGGTSEIAIISLAAIAECESLRVAGDDFDDSIIKRV